MTGSAHTIVWAAAARRKLQRLPEKVGTAVVEFVYATLAHSPRRVGRELHLELAGHHSARRGDYRIIYRIDDDARQVTIVAVDHRADVYRPR